MEKRAILDIIVLDFCYPKLRMRTDGHGRKKTRAFDGSAALHNYYRPKYKAEFPLPPPTFAYT